MSETNSLVLTYQKKPGFGTAIVTPDMTKLRVTDVSFKPNLFFDDSDDIRDDRGLEDSDMVGREISGGFGFRFRPFAYDDFWEAAMFSAWANSINRYNVTADSAITDVVASTDTYTVANGTAFAAQYIVVASGFTNAANNRTFVATGGSATTCIATDGAVDEAAPPAGARLHVVGYEGTTGQITATSTGLAGTGLGTALLAMGVGVSDIILVGGSATGNKFAVSALNVPCKIGAITADAITFEYLPASWAVNDGSGKNIRIFVADKLNVGTTLTAFFMQQVLSRQTTPVYLQWDDLVVNTFNLDVQNRRTVRGGFTFLGRVPVGSGTDYDSTSNAATTQRSFVSGKFIKRVQLAQGRVTIPNWCQSLRLNFNNQLRGLQAVDELDLVDIRPGKFMTDINLGLYFGDNSYWARAISELPTDFFVQFERDAVSYIFEAPRLKLVDVDTPVPGPDADGLLNLQGRVTIDTASTARQFTIYRFRKSQ